jgi:hypothetical protein
VSRAVGSSRRLGRLVHPIGCNPRSSACQHPELNVAHLLVIGEELFNLLQNAGSRSVRCFTLA